MSNFTENRRARLSPAPRAFNEVLGPDDCFNILQPLRRTKGLIFPYTPDVIYNRTANYTDYHFTHSNYKFNQFQNSAPGEIQITAEFAVQTNEEARYFIAAMRFLQASTMIEFGVSTPSARRGVPPPVLRFNYLGGQMFNNVPVVVSMVNFNFDRSVDYVEVTFPTANQPLQPPRDLRQLVSRFGASGVIREEDRRTFVPTKSMIVATLVVQQNPRNVRENFNLEDFKTGKLLNRGFI